MRISEIIGRCSFRSLVRARYVGMNFRIFASSTSSSEKSCFPAYQADFHGCMMPTRKPVGRTFWPMLVSSSRTGKMPVPQVPLGGECRGGGGRLGGQGGGLFHGVEVGQRHNNVGEPFLDAERGAP